MKKYLVLFCSIFIIVGCSPSSSEQSEKVTLYQENFEIIGEEKDEIIGEINEKVFDSIERREKDEENVLDIKSMKDRPHKVSTGRYRIYGFGTGFIYLYDENDQLIHKDFFAYGMDSVTVDIKEEYSVRLNGFDRAFIREVDTELSNTITPGIWEVGTDIEAGNYTVTGEGYGYLKILEPSEEPLLFEVVGSPFAGSKSNIQLVDGQKLVLHGAKEVNFEPNN